MNTFKKIIGILILLFFIPLTNAQSIRYIQKLKDSGISETNHVILDNSTPLPQGYKSIPRKVSIQKTRAITNDFLITYVANGERNFKDNKTCETFPNDAKTAFDYATQIWSAYITTTVPIAIEACWTSDGFSGELGVASTYSISNTDNLPYNDTNYALSLVNMFAQRDVHPDYFDSVMAYNPGYSWYFGTDGIVPSDQHDFVSVVLHEIAHALNITGKMRYDGATNKGYYSNFPGIWGRFIVDENGSSILDEGNNTTALGDLLHSDNLFFSGSNANAGNAGNEVKIYAPDPWSASSYVHLDQTTFESTLNALMVPRLATGVARHDPGAIIIGMLKDLGWTMESIDVPCTYSIDPLEYYIPHAGATKTVTITSSPTNCNSGSWNATENLDWVTLSGDTQGVGKGSWSLEYTVRVSNSGLIGNINIGQNTHKINQLGQLIVYDERTKLYWQDDLYTNDEATAYQDTQTENGKVLLWDNAKSYCKNLDYVGFNDWYLPTKEELESIINMNNSPTIESAFYSTVGAYFWTSTTSPTDIQQAYSINFNTGSIGTYDKNYNGYIRCVRRANSNPAIIMYLLN